MEPAQQRDALQAAAIALLAPIIVLIKGDPLYIGLWYYLVIPILIIGAGVLMDAAPRYLTGASLAVSAAYFIYMTVNYTAARPEGLLVLGHLCSAPGGVIGHLLGIAVAKRYAVAVPMLLLGALGWGLGFFLNNLVICNTHMYCGPLSLKALL